jgi:hypothetical protein
MEARMQGSGVLLGTAATLTLLLVVFICASAHHAPTEFDFDKTVEVEGTIVEWKWQNPHVTFKIGETRSIRPCSYHA